MMAMAIYLWNFQSQRSLMITSALLLLASALYTLAILSNGWFIVQPTSYYGIWSVTFCDFLRCQDISAIFNDEPNWYRVVQLLNMIGIASVILSVLLTLTHIFNLPSCFHKYRSAAISFCCLVSVISISAGLFVFYSHLIQESPLNHPHISWAAGLAVMTCLLQLFVAVLIKQS